MTIHNRIRSRRRQLGLTMQAIATACEVSWQAVQRWETIAAPKRNNLLRLASILNVNVDWLMTGNGTPNSKLALDFSKISGKEAQLVMFYRSMNEPDKEELMRLANQLSQNCIDEFGAVLFKTKEAPNISDKRNKTTKFMG